MSSNKLLIPYIELRAIAEENEFLAAYADVQKRILIAFAMPKESLGFDVTDDLSDALRYASVGKSAIMNKHDSAGILIVDVIEVTTPLKHFYAIAPMDLRDLYRGHMEMHQAEKNVAYSVQHEYTAVKQIFNTKKFLIEMSVFNQIFRPLATVDNIECRTISKQYFPEFHNTAWQKVNSVLVGAV